jgi:formylglycine-generating enzyme required for sulfatase activity
VQLVAAAVLGLFALTSSMARVGPGVYRPLYPPSPAEKEIPVKAFLLDRLPVTDGDFLAFVRAHPEWRRDRVPRVFADDGYLSQWAAPDALGPEVDERQPVVRVSWFAAKAYCAARGARLPTEAEWELAASGTPRAQILSWYARPNPAQLPRVGSTPANSWGVQDLHGVVWEWVLDFDSSMVTPDARGFCGAGALEAIDKDDYPTFMRVAFRSSLRADYTTRNLGFRCAADIEGGAR